MFKDKKTSRARELETLEMEGSWRRVLDAGSWGIRSGLSEGQAWHIVVAEGVGRQCTAEDKITRELQPLNISFMYIIWAVVLERVAVGVQNCQETGG